MTITPHTLAKESPIEDLALLEVGEPKAGKSWTAATAPGTILFLDFDQRFGALRAHPNAANVYGLTLADPSNSKVMPTAMSEAFSIMNKIEQRPFLRNVYASFPDIPIDTIVLDSIQTIADAAKNYVLFNAGNDGLSRNFVIKDRIVRVPKSYAAWGAEQEMTTSLVLQARSLLHCRKCWKSVTSWISQTGHLETIHTDELIAGGTLRITDPKLLADHEPQPRAMNVIATLHETPEEAPNSTDDNPVMTGKIIVYPKRYKTLLVYFNEVWRLTRTYGRVPKVTCDPDGQFTQAATALGIAPNVAYEPNIQSILAKAKKG